MCINDKTHFTTSTLVFETNVTSLVMIRQHHDTIINPSYELIRLDNSFM
jgi:hypothetical protein